MTEKSFVDTNIFVYARDSSDKKKQSMARRIIASLKREDLLVISSQVVTEFCSVMTTKLKSPPNKVKSDVLLMLELEPVPLSAEVLRQGLTLYEQYSLSWWDSWIIAAAIESNCGVIYSEDLSTGATYHGVKVVNPFS